MGRASTNPLAELLPIAAAVEAAVARAMEPVRVEVAKLRQELAQRAAEPITMREAAHRLGVSLRTIERRVAAQDPHRPDRVILPAPDA